MATVGFKGLIYSSCKPG